MKLARALPILLALSATAAADESAALSFQWPEGARWRVIDRWEVEALNAAGERTSARAGVTRATWTVTAVGGAPVLAPKDAVTVQASPKDDAVAKAVAAALVEPFRLDATVAAAPRPAPEVATLAAAPDDDDAPPADAAPADAPAADAAPATPPAPGSADPVSLVRAGTHHRLARTLGALSGRRVRLGQPLALEGVGEDAADVLVRVDPLPWCPDTGPGTRCVQVTVVRAWDGVPVEGEVAQEGRREREEWIVEPTGLTPHGARFVWEVSTEDAGGKVAVQRATRELAFLPAEPPAPLAP